MKGSFHQVIDALANSPEVAKASGISEERTLIIDMIELRRLMAALMSASARSVVADRVGRAGAVSVPNS